MNGWMDGSLLFALYYFGVVLSFVRLFVWGFHVPRTTTNHPCDGWPAGRMGMLLTSIDTL